MVFEEENERASETLNARASEALMAFEEDVLDNHDDTFAGGEDEEEHEDGYAIESDAIESESYENAIVDANLPIQRVDGESETEEPDDEVGEDTHDDVIDELRVYFSAVATAAPSRGATIGPCSDASRVNLPIQRVDAGEDEIEGGYNDENACECAYLRSYEDVLGYEDTTNVVASEGAKYEDALVGTEEGDEEEYACAGEEASEANLPIQRADGDDDDDDVGDAEVKRADGTHDFIDLNPPIQGEEEQVDDEHAEIGEMMQSTPVKAWPPARASNTMMQPTIVKTSVKASKRKKNNHCYRIEFSNGALATPSQISKTTKKQKKTMQCQQSTGLSLEIFTPMAFWIPRTKSMTKSMKTKRHPSV
jgi:hypothetical protein